MCFILFMFPKLDLKCYFVIIVAYKGPSIQIFAVNPKRRLESIEEDEDKTKKQRRKRQERRNILFTPCFLFSSMLLPKLHYCIPNKSKHN